MVVKYERKLVLFLSSMIKHDSCISASKEAIHDS